MRRPSKGGHRILAFLRAEKYFAQKAQRKNTMFMKIRCLTFREGKIIPYQQDVKESVCVYGAWFDGFAE